MQDKQDKKLEIEKLDIRNWKLEIGEEINGNLQKLKEIIKL